MNDDFDRGVYFGCLLTLWLMFLGWVLYAHHVKKNLPDVVGKQEISVGKDLQDE